MRQAAMPVGRCCADDLLNTRWYAVMADGKMLRKRVGKCGDLHCMN